MRFGCGIAAGVILGLGSSVAVAQVSLTYSEEAAARGLTAMYDAPQFLGIQFQAAGGAVGDFDRDGDQDLFVLGGGADASAVDMLFINDGTGHFTEQGAAWGIDVAHRGFGACVGDYDADGWLDIYVTSNGPPGIGWQQGLHKLYKNVGGLGFTDVAASAGVSTTWSGSAPPDAHGAAFGDFDRNGTLDLAVAGWYGQNRLFMNMGNGTFFNVTSSRIIASMGSVRGFAPRFTDMNNDGWPELLWVADFFTSKYLVNQGGYFFDRTASAGTGLDSNGMGNTVADFNGDGLPDWYVTSRINTKQTAGSGNMLYMNQGNHTYTETSVAAGVNYGLWGWGTSARDYNHDTLPDIIATNGWDGEFLTDPTRVYLANGDGTFSESAADTGLIDPGQGRGLLDFDIEGDGDRDIVIFNNDQPLSLWVADIASTSANWTRLFFNTSNMDGLPPDGFGTHVTVIAGGKQQVSQLDGGSNYLATSELSVHFGLADATVIDELRVRWADGTETTLYDRPVNRTLTIFARPDCDADWNVDDNVATNDFVAFLNDYNRAQAGQMPVYGDPDLSPPYGVLNTSDFVAFLQAWTGGCP